MRSPTLLLILACTLVACGGSDSGGPVDSGLPAERKGSELSDAEAEQLCEASARHLASQLDNDDIHHFNCVFQAITAASISGMVETCEGIYDMCIQMPYTPDDSGGACMLGDLTMCQATVGDMEACFTERNNATATAFKAASCNDLGKEPTEPTDGPACSKARASCPGI
jgi:hypothetical protein